MIRFLRLPVLLIALGWGHAAGAPPASVGENSPDHSRSSFRDRFESVLRGSVDETEAKALIADLAAPDFQRRARAAHHLLTAKNIPAGILEAAADSPDLEVSLSARRILLLRPNQQQTAITACLRDAHAQRPENITDLLFHVLSTTENPDIESLALAAAESCPCGPEAVEIAARQIGSKNEAVQTAAVYSLVNGGKAGSVRDMLETLPPAVCAEAARALWNSGDPAAPLTWLALLSSDDATSRAAAAQYLREATAQKFGFSAHVEKEAREPVLLRWRTWLTSVDRPAAERAERNRISSLSDPHALENQRLVAGGKSVYFLSTHGTLLSEVKMSKRVDSVQLTPANTLIVFSRERETGVTVTDLTGQLVRKIKGRSAVDANVAPDGSILVFSFIEEAEPRLITVEGESTPLSFGKRWVTSAVPLPDGSYIVSAEDSPLRRMTPGKKEPQWSIKNLSGAGFVRPLPNGNVLVSALESGKLAEVTPGGEVVWESKLRGEAIAIPLRNGNYLLQRRNKFSEKTPNGDGDVWEKQVRELKGRAPREKMDAEPLDPGAPARIPRLEF